jgi:hypothetical protein
MADVDVGDGTTTSDFPDGVDGSGIKVNQTVNQAQAQANTQQQQQQQGLVPVVVTPVVGAQNQGMSGPSILIPLDTHTQAQGLFSQLGTLLGL